MNDDTLTTALDRMSTALEPPTTADELISARRAQLRRRRRVTTGLAAASVVAIVTTGGVVASGLGNASPQHDEAPVASDGPAPANDAAPDTAVDPAPEVLVAVQENEGPWHCKGEDGSMTPAEVEAFRNEVIDNAQLSLDLQDDKIRAYVVIPEDGDVVYELDVRKAGPDDFEIVSVVKCDG